MQKKTWIGIAAVIALAIAGGAFLATYEPTREFATDAWYGDTLRETRQSIADPLASDHWRRAERTDKGVTVWDPLSAQRGFTLYTSGEGAVARLVTMTGALVHEWSIPYSRVWAKERAAVQEPQPDNLVFLREARLLPNGDLIGMYEAAGHVPSGYGLVKVDKDSRPIWSYLQRVHGGFDIAPDGRVFALSQVIRTEDAPKSGLKPPFLEDVLVVLSPDGKEIRRLSLVEALAASRYASLLKAGGKPPADPLGANSIDYVGDTAIKGVPGGGPGRVLVSLGALGAVAVVDADNGAVVWAARGAWKSQHGAFATPDGELLVVDNPTGQAARALQVNPAGMSVTWSYTGQPDQLPFASASDASAQRLSNGNTLLTEPEGGRLFEVDRTGTIVWEYTNPARGGKGDAYMPVISSGRRIAAQALDSSFRGFTRP